MQRIDVEKENFLKARKMGCYSSTNILCDLGVSISILLSLKEKININRVW